MHSLFFNSLSTEGKNLVSQAMNALSARYDETLCMVLDDESGKNLPAVRPSMYYALGLMMLNEDGCAEKAEKICERVIATQIDAPEEIFHGIFHHAGQPDPRQGVLDYKRLGLYGRYFTDLFYEKTVNAFRRNLQADERFRDHWIDIEGLLNKAVIAEYPVVWATYEPNSREFILMCYAMLLEHFSAQLSSECIDSIEHSALIALEGAIHRSVSEFNPLNTNIQCMHVFTLDYFGQRFSRQDFCDYALQYAEQMVEKYMKYHSAAEFNSPTYCSVDLSTLGFWRRYGSCNRLKELGKTLEHGLWRDFAEFYNPAMQNICGPYSRAYELEMGKHTAFHALLYWALGEKSFPWHPFTTETVCNTLMVFGGVDLPEDVRKAIFEPKNGVTIHHEFRELSERGEPGKNDALCTATGWITPSFMVGAMAGSENPSNQLHPLVVFWRGEKGLGTIKVLRRTAAPEHKMNHLHTVLFNAVAEKNHITLDVERDVNRDIEVYFEIEYPEINHSAVIENTVWKLPGLEVRLQTSAPAPSLEKNCRIWGSPEEDVLRVCYLSEACKPENRHLHFDIEMNTVT